ncbi:hypothetical protein [Desulfosporosinus sp. SB140]|uniref:hypothetical protein n=1 Tax=Desulfosporosinus paludis TaxID=3115649 RepID=UPI0038910846
MFQITMDTGPVEQLAMAATALNVETITWLEDMAGWINNDLKERAPVKTSRLKNSIRYQIDRNANGGEATFFSAFYGPYLDEGTKPHVISPVNAKCLVFSRGGEKVFASSVHHPGTKPLNFTPQTLDEAEKEADRKASLMADRIFGVMA